MKKTIKIIFAMLAVIALPHLIIAQTTPNVPLKNSPTHSRPGIKLGNQQVNATNAANTVTINRLHGKSQAYNWDSTNTWQWVWQYEEITKYDNKGRINLDAQIDTTTNDTSSKTATSYGANGSIFNIYYSYQNGALMQNTTLDSTVYDTKGNQVRYVYYSLDTTNKWLLSSGYIDKLAYDANGNEVSDLDIVYNAAWVNNVEDKYAVNANGSWKTDTTKSWNGAQWVNTGLIDSIAWESWNGINNSQVSSSVDKIWGHNSWQDSVKSSWVYNANGASVETDQLRNGGKWVNYTRESLPMDNFGNSTGSSNDTFNGSAWVEVFGEQINLTYDANDNITQEIDQYYDIPSKQYINSNKFVYSAFSAFTAIKGANRPNLQLSIYPNPATEMLHLQSGAIATSESMNISIYNMNGQEVLSQQTTGNALSAGINIEVNSLAKGVYILHAISCSQDINEKFIKE